jgi:hypothetical protein
MDRFVRPVPGVLVRRTLARLLAITAVACSALVLTPGTGLAWYFKDGFSASLSPCKAGAPRGSVIPLSATKEAPVAHESQWSSWKTINSSPSNSIKVRTKWRPVTLRVVESGPCVRGTQRVRVVYADYEHKTQDMLWVKRGDGEFPSPVPNNPRESGWTPGIGSRPIPPGQV